MAIIIVYYSVAAFHEYIEFNGTYITGFLFSILPSLRPLHVVRSTLILASIFQPLYSDVCISFLCSRNKAHKPQVQVHSATVYIHPDDVMIFHVHRCRTFSVKSLCAMQRSRNSFKSRFCVRFFPLRRQLGLLLGDFHISYLINLNAIPCRLFESLVQLFEINLPLYGASELCWLMAERHFFCRTIFALCSRIMDSAH